MSESFIDPIEAAGEPRGPETPATFAARLLANRTPVAQLSPMEKRLLAIAADLFGNCVGLACVGRTRADEIDPLTTEIVVEGARLAVAAAVEIEQHLRGVREHVEARR